jgi:hypothetical protein
MLPLLQKLVDIKPELTSITLNDSITLNIKSPGKFCDITYEDYLYSATIDNKEHIFTVEERSNIFASLPVNRIESIKKYTLFIEDELKKIIFKIINTDVVCGLEDQSLFELIKLFYRDSIVGCQRRLLAVSNYTELSTEYIMNLPPVEVEMYISYIEEQEAKNKPAGRPNLPGQLINPGMP